MNAEIKHLRQKADEQWKLGHLNEADAAYRQLTSLLESDPTCSQEEAWLRAEITTKRRVEIAIHFDRWEVVEQLLNEVKPIYEHPAVRNHLGLVMLTYTRARIAIDQGDHQRAEAILSEVPGVSPTMDFTHDAFTRFEKTVFTHVEKNAFELMGLLYTALGKIQAVRGDFQHAIAAFERGRLCCSPVPKLDRQILVVLTLELASVYLNLGELTRAEAEVAHVNRIMGDDLTWVARVKKNSLLGQLAFLRGDLGTAKVCFEAVKTLCEERGSEASVMRATLNMVQLLIALNQPGIAVEGLKKVREARYYQEDLVLHARTDSLLSIAQARQHRRTRHLRTSASTDSTGRTRGVRSWNKESVTAEFPESELNLPSQDYMARFENGYFKFEQLLNTNDGIEAAEQWFAGLQKEFANSQSPLVTTRLLVMKGLCDFYSSKDKKYDSAETSFRDASSSLRKAGLKRELLQVLPFLAYCLSHRDADNEARTLIKEADILLDGHIKSLEAADKALFLVGQGRIKEAYVKEMLTHIAPVSLKTTNHSQASQIGSSSLGRRMFCNIRNTFRTYQLTDSLADIIDYIDRYKGTLMEKRASPTGMVRSAIRRFQRLRHMPEGCVTLYFLVLEEELVVIRIGGQHDGDPILQAYHRGVKRQDLQDAVTPCYWAIKKNCRNIDEIRSRLQAIAELIGLDDLLYDIPTKSRLVFVPHDCLHALPIAALPYPSKQTANSNGKRSPHYLVETFPVSLAFEGFQHNVRSASVRSALLVGSTYGAPPLYTETPNVEYELQDGQEFLHQHGVQVQCLLNEREGKNTLLKIAQEVNLLHIASHGKFDTDDLLRSGLILIPLPKSQDLISLTDFVPLDLRKMEQVVLSSCYGVSSQEFPTWQLISLPEILWRAGAKSILGCLWPAIDDFAPHFFKSFYQQIEKNVPRDEALRAVQQQCINEEFPEYIAKKRTPEGEPNLKNPWYWAGFQVYGDNGPLLLGESSAVSRGFPSQQDREGRV